MATEGPETSAGIEGTASKNVVQDPTAASAAAKVEVVVSSAAGDTVFGPAELLATTSVGEIAALVSTGDGDASKKPRILCESELLEPEQSIAQLAHKSSPLELLALWDAFAFSSWDGEGACVNGPCFEKTERVPRFSWAIGDTGHTEGTVTWLLKKTKGDDHGFRLGVGNCSCTTQDLNQRKGWCLYSYMDRSAREENGHVQSFANENYKTLSMNMPNLSKCGSEMKITLDCDKHTVTFHAYDKSYTIEHLPTCVPLHLCMVAWADAVGNTWEVSFG